MKHLIYFILFALVVTACTHQAPTENIPCYIIRDADRSLHDHGSFGIPYEGLTLSEFVDTVRASQIFTYECLLPSSMGNRDGYVDIAGYVTDTSTHEAYICVYFNLETELIDSIHSIIVPDDL